MISKCFFHNFTLLNYLKLKNFLFIVAVAIVALVVLLLIVNPEILDKIWLWLIGFAGGILGLFRNFYDQALSVFSKKLDVPDLKPKQEPAIAVLPNTQLETVQKLDNLARKIDEKSLTQLNSTFNGTTLTVLRYIDDGETTLGLLFFRDSFFSYSLEDTYRDVKVMGETRIPAGEYTVDFNKMVTDLTQTYRNKYPWFAYHLEIKDVPNFGDVYIHIGNTSADTMGCLLIADGIDSSSAHKSLTLSMQAFQRFYKRMKDLLDNGEKIRIVIHDENWFQKINIQNI